MNTQICPNKTVPGGMLSISANGNQKDTGIIWAVFPSSGQVIRHMCDAAEPSQAPNRLLAFHAETLKLLWQVNLPGRSQYVPPTVADGKVYVPVGNRLMAYELDVPPDSANKKTGLSEKQPASKPYPRAARRRR
jgi:hypothetical protein